MYYQHNDEPPKGGFDVSGLAALQQAEVWPENWPSFELFSQMSTQWRIGMSGPTGLDYNVLFAVMEQRKLTGEDWDSTFQDVRVMEAAALESMRTSRT